MSFSGELVTEFLQDISHQVNREVISALFFVENPLFSQKNCGFLLTNRLKKLINRTISQAHHKKP